VRALRSRDAIMNKRRPFVLIVENDDDVRAHLVCALRHDGYDVTAARTTAEALAAMTSDPYGAPAAVVANAWLSGVDRLMRMRPLRGEARAPMFFLTTTRATPPVHAMARALGADAVFDVPVEIDALCAALRGQSRARSLAS
jgi:two-component system response regulator (stage 0 sporulation protein F)